jgi:hypothetical protein
MDLEKIITESQIKFNKTEDESLIRMLASYESHVDEAYEGRLFFELIQNARDAAYLRGIESEILIYVKQDIVYFANTGQPFNEGGILGMTRLGLSDKKDNKLIGKKGIGFKAIQQYTKTPNITTPYGTMYFDRSGLWERLSQKHPEDFMDEMDVPLFVYPYFDATNTEDLQLEGNRYDTVVWFALNQEKTAQDIIDLYEEITDEELALLGNIKSIRFIAEGHNHLRDFSYERPGFVTIESKGKPKVFRVFSPGGIIEITDDIYDALDKKEKKLFAKDRSVSIKIVFELNDKGGPLKKDSKLFLYYPLEVDSGFSYIIHGDFSVNPERKALRQTRLNEFLFSEIARLQTGVILDYLKEAVAPESLLEFLLFSRHSHLDYFYRQYIDLLQVKDFIWVKQCKEYMSPGDVILCAAEDYKLFKGHTIVGRYLLHVPADQQKFLEVNFGVPKLQKQDISEAIEGICEKERSNASFFQQLYSYCCHANFDMSDKKILLSSIGELVAKQDDVFYVVKEEVAVPDTIANRLILLHSDIKIDTEMVPIAKRVIGIREFSTLELTEKALALMPDDGVERMQVLKFLKGLTNVSEAVSLAIRRKIYVPASQGSMQTVWARPLYNPVYMQSDQLRELYPDGYFVNIDKCMAEADGTADEWQSFFLKCGVWDMPGMYLIQKSETIDTGRVGALNIKVGKRANGFEIRNDRMIDFPKIPNYYFFSSILKNWNEYMLRMTASQLEFSVKSFGASYGNAIEDFAGFTSFVNVLRREAWIYIAEDKTPLAPNEVIGLNKDEVAAERLLPRYLNILPLDYQKEASFAEKLGIKHFNGGYNDHIVSILKQVSRHYAYREGEALDAEFRKFYHVVLKYLYRFYIKDQSQGGTLANRLKNVLFLSGQTGDTERISWRKPDEIYHIDDRNVFEQLTEAARNHLGYFFTKSDRNEIGKVFAKIGILLSKEVMASVVMSDTVGGYLFYEQMNNLPYMIQVIEDKLENNLDEKQFNAIKTANLVLHDTVQGKMELRSSPGFESTVSLAYHYDLKQNSLHLPLGSYPFQNKTLQGNIINEVLSRITGVEFDYGRLFRDLLYGTSHPLFKEALKEVEHNKDRVTEIEEILSCGRHSLEQQFWNAFLLAKDITDTVFDAQDGQIDHEYLYNALSADRSTVARWISDFNYVELNASGNYEIFSDMVRLEDIDFAALCGYLQQTVSYEYRYKAAFEKHKNRYSDKVCLLLHHYHAGQGIGQQQKFGSHLATVFQLEAKPFEADRLDFSVSQDFMDRLNESFGFISFDQESLDGADEKLWQQISIELPKRKREFLRRLKSQGKDASHFETFMGSEANYSLLYFSAYDSLSGLYEKAFPTKAKAIKEGDPELDPQYDELEEDDAAIVPCVLKEGSLGPSDPFAQAIAPSPGRGYGGGGWPKLPNAENLKLIGLQGERLLYLKYVKAYGQSRVRWVSENAAAYGYKPDTYARGYDMSYIDEQDQIHYVEVKTSTHQAPEFHITINEINSARHHGSNYHVIWIINLYDKGSRQYLDMHNIFTDFSDGEDFFHNSKFHPQLTAFKITFKPQLLIPMGNDVPGDPNVTKDNMQSIDG